MKCCGARSRHRRPSSAHRLEAYYGLLTTFDDGSGPARQPIDGMPGLAGGLSFRFAASAGPGQLHAGPRAVGSGDPGVRGGRPLRPHHADGLAPLRGAGNCRRLPGPGLAGPTTRRRGLRRPGDGVGGAAGLSSACSISFALFTTSRANRRKPWPWPSGCLLRCGPFNRTRVRPGKTGSNCGSMRAGPAAILPRTSPLSGRSRSANEAAHQIYFAEMTRGLGVVEPLRTEAPTSLAGRPS